MPNKLIIILTLQLRDHICTARSRVKAAAQAVVRETLSLGSPLDEATPEDTETVRQRNINAVNAALTDCNFAYWDYKVSIKLLVLFDCVTKSPSS